MKKLYLPILITIILLLASNLPAVEITYNVTSGGNTASLTTDYDLSEGSRADSQIDITSNPSISSQTTINAQGDENNIEVTTGANDGAGSTSNASVRIFDNVETASINTNANASNSTNASVNATGTGAMAGYIKGESDGTKKFCGFTGDFNASSDAGGGNVGITSSYTNPKANIFIVTKDQNNTPCHDTVYDDIPDVFDPNVGPAETPSDTGVPPNYIFVDHDGDQDKYTGAEIAGKNNLTLLGVWGADNTTIDGRAGGGDTLYVHDSPNITIEGFTVTGGIYKGSGGPGNFGDGISIYNSDNAQVTGNTANGNGITVGLGAGIYVESSGDVTVTGNTANGNGWSGIYVESSGDVTVTGNTANGNGVDGWGDGICVWSDGNAQVTGNTANENGLAGIAVLSVGDATVTGNTANGNGITEGLGAGIYVKSGGTATVTGNTANGNGITEGLWAGIYVESGGTATVTGNTANGNGGFGIGVAVYDSHSATVTGNTVSSNVASGVSIFGTSNSVNVHENNIFGNGIGLTNTTVNKVAAENNWWGPGGTGGPGEGEVGKENNGVDNSSGGTTKVFPWSHVKF